MPDHHHFIARQGASTGPMLRHPQARLSHGATPQRRRAGGRLLLPTIVALFTLVAGCWFFSLSGVAKAQRLDAVAAVTAMRGATARGAGPVHGPAAAHEVPRLAIRLIGGRVTI